jgi:hypothetical protein
MVSFITSIILIYTQIWIQHITTYTRFPCYEFPLLIPASTYLAPSRCDRNCPPQSQVARKLTPLVPRCSLVPFPPNSQPFLDFPESNVYLIRAHHKPPSQHTTQLWLLKNCAYSLRAYNATEPAVFVELGAGDPWKSQTRKISFIVEFLHYTTGYFMNRSLICWFLATFLISLLHDYLGLCKLHVEVYL